MKRAVAAVAARIDRRAALQQQAHQRRVAARRCNQQGRVAVGRVSVLNISPDEQSSSYPFSFTLAGRVQQLFARGLLAGSDQQRRQLLSEAPRLCRRRRRLLRGGVEDARRGLVLQQLVNHFQVAARYSFVIGRSARLQRAQCTRAIESGAARKALARARKPPPRRALERAPASAPASSNAATMGAKPAAAATTSGVCPYCQSVPVAHSAPSRRY